MSVCFLTVLGIQCLRGVEAAKVTMSFTSQFFGGLPTSGGAWVLWGLVRILFFFFKGSSLQWIWDWKPPRAKPKEDVSMKVERAVHRLLCACVPLIIRHKACRNPAVQSMLFQCDFAQCFTTLFFPFFFFFFATCRQGCSLPFYAFRREGMENGGDSFNAAKIFSSL